MSYDELADGERPVLIVHPHWKTIFGPLVVAIIVIAAALAAEVLIPSGKYAAVERLSAAGVALIIVMTWLMVPLLRWRFKIYELTNRRFRLREGIISRKGRDIPLSRITDVSFSKGLLDRLLGCGKLVVESAGEHGELVLTEIPHVERVQSLLFELVEQERGRISRDDRGTID